LPLDTKRLRQILELENKRGYNNTAVIGGLDRFLTGWADSNLPLIPSPVLLRCLRKFWPKTFSYAALSIQKRCAWGDQVIAFITEIEKPQPDLADIKVAQIKKKGIIKTATRTEPKSGINDSISLESPITGIKGISTVQATKFARLGIKTIRDLVYFFPHRHLNYSQLLTISQLVEGMEQTIMASVWEVRPTFTGARRSTEATLGDESGNMRAVWFNNPWMARQIHSGDRIVVSGRVKVFHGRPVFESPEWEAVDDKELIHTGRLVPVYPLTSGLHQRQVRKLIKMVVDQYAVQLPEYLPEEIRVRRNYLFLSEAVSQSHFPDTIELKDRARTRLAFDELFLLQLGVMARKRRWQTAQPGLPLKIDHELLERVRSSLPFELTSAQKRVISEIMSDLANPIPMSRLLQGEVGSGKTVVALMSLLVAVSNGYQGALMAPTEILAGQHLSTVRRLLTAMGREEAMGNYCYRFVGIMKRPITIAILMGDISASAKRELKNSIASGEVDIAIGTHALIQKEIAFNKLGLVVVDEQHRFGVEQRSSLRQKGFNPHMLVMTATPIPRTLALTLYGDLDLSVINELPPGRQIIKTKWLQPNQRESAYRFMRKQINEKHQAFIICPLVEESESIEAKAAVIEFERLSRDVFPDLRMSLLHGRMAARDKDKIMAGFNRHEVDILVSTPVVEVGIDVPNATVMLVESADRFGLSQLHQFRGRVGRGSAPSYCMLMAEKPSDIARMRLDIIESTQDGFELADQDLKLRGPGEFFGTRQSGLPHLKMARLSDVAILEMARAEAQSIFKQDPDLRQYQELSKELVRVWPASTGVWS
jgi:ATP-dependent DNA helicase RecG